MPSNVVDQRGLTIIAAKFKGKLEGEESVAASDVSVAAGDEGLAAGTLQETLQDIYDILATKADA